MSRKTALVTLAVLLFGVGFHMSVNPAYACVCDETSTEEELEWADTVFRGKVNSIDSQSIVLERPWGKENWFEDMVEFHVSEVWKGEPHETISVKSMWVKNWETFETSCGSIGPSFYEGEEYLVFVYDNRAETGMCSMSAFIDEYGETQEKLVDLGAGAQPIPGSVGPVPIRDSVLLPDVSASEHRSEYDRGIIAIVVETPTPKTTTWTTSIVVHRTPRPEVRIRYVSENQTIMRDSEREVDSTLLTPAPSTRSGGGCGLSSGSDSGGMDLWAFGLVVGLAWFRLRQGKS